MKLMTRLLQALLSPRPRADADAATRDASSIAARRRVIRKTGVASLALAVPVVGMRQSDAASPQFKLPVGGAVARTLDDKFADDIDAKDFGAKGDGKNDDTAAINAALGYANSLGGGTVTLGPGQYLISSAIVVLQGCTLRGMSPFGTKLTAADANCKIVYQSNSGVYDLRFDGGGKARVGFEESGSINRASVARIRIENCTQAGFCCGTKGQVNNSTFMDIFSQFNPVNFLVVNALNCSFICCNGNLRSAAQGGLAGDRNIKVGGSAATGNGTCRNTTFVKGIFERSEVAEYGIEVAHNNNLGFHAVEFNSGKVAKILLNGGDVNIFEPHFTLGAGDIAISESDAGGTAWLYGPPSVTGREGRTDRALFRCALMQDGRPGTLAFSYAGRTLLGMLSLSGGAQKAIAGAAVAVTLGHGDRNAASCLSNRGLASKGDHLDLLEYEIYVLQADAGIAAFQDGTAAGSRKRLGTLQVGLNRFYATSDDAQLRPLLFVAENDSGPAPKVLIKSVSLRIV